MPNILHAHVKNFIDWFKIKPNIHQKEQRPLFKEGEIWWCQMGENIGDEENGKGINFMRPVAVISKFNKNICLVAPTSTKLKDNKYYYEIDYKSQKYSVLVSQIRVMDTKRFKKKIAQLSNNDLQKLKDYLSKTLF